jgi:hypothetical protein
MNETSNMNEALGVNDVPVTRGLDSVAAPQVSEWRRFFRILFQRKLVMFSVVLVILLIVAIFAP